MEIYLYSQYVFALWCLIKHRNKLPLPYPIHLHGVMLSVFMMWYLVKNRDKFNFTLLIPYAFMA